MKRRRPNKTKRAKDRDRFRKTFAKWWAILTRRDDFLDAINFNAFQRELAKAYGVKLRPLKRKRRRAK